MGKKHDENRDVKLLSRIVRVDSHTKRISCPKGTQIGIHAWGKIDYLTHYCGYVFIYNNDIVIRSVSDTDSSDKRKKKKEVKQETKSKKNGKSKVRVQA